MNKMTFGLVAILSCVAGSLVAEEEVIETQEVVLGDETESEEAGELQATISEDSHQGGKGGCGCGKPPRK